MPHAAEYVNGVLSKSYAHGDQVDEPLFQISGSNVFNITSDTFSYFVADHQGSIVGRAGQNGKSVQTIAYDVYGIPAIKNAAANDRFGYTGQLWFKELGLYYYKARMYHPKLGRFLQTDPIGYKDDMNWYAYVGNDPVNKRDPSGLAVCDASFTGSNCDKGLDDSDKARDTARSDASNISALAGRVKAGTTSASDQAALKEFGGRFGAKFTSAKSLDRLAKGLNAAADKIGARGEGAVLTMKESKHTAQASPFTQKIYLSDMYFGLGDSTRQQVMLHEAAHLAWAWRDKYIEEGKNDLYNNNMPIFGAQRNADTYACISYPSECGF